ncbi:YkuS family protein [Kroppenstedtia guangzhouensis]|uniref:YkuS family protein n=1 Tax=Kroppenstedtia guangzhouensis TaxID=1274356 RepID=UPI00166AEE2F|nr:YkuS family protein [Kroppenstedtia guangzhouensis]
MIALTNYRVAVEEGLKNVREYLQNQGCDVVSLERDQTQDCNCFVISGMDKDLMGMQDTVDQIQVINAQGMTPDEVYQAVRRGMDQQQG